jgi:hypothetical protein
MPQQTFTGKDGKQYIDAPGMDPIPVEDLQPHPASVLDQVWSGIRGASPEIIGGLSALLAPETGALSLAIPPLAAGATEGLKEWADTGSTQSMSGRDIGARTLINAVPGVAGEVYARGGNAVPNALKAASRGNNWVASVARGLHALGTGEPTLETVEGVTPEILARSTSGARGTIATQIEGLKTKLTDPALNAQAKAAVLNRLRQLMSQQQSLQAGTLAQRMRAILGLGSGVANVMDQDQQ